MSPHTRVARFRHTAEVALILDECSLAHSVLAGLYEAADEVGVDLVELSAWEVANLADPPVRQNVVVCVEGVIVVQLDDVLTSVLPTHLPIQLLLEPKATLHALARNIAKARTHRATVPRPTSSSSYLLHQLNLKQQRQKQLQEQKEAPLGRGKAPLNRRPTSASPELCSSARQALPGGRKTTIRRRDRDRDPRDVEARLEWQVTLDKVLDGSFSKFTFLTFYRRWCTPSALLSALATRYEDEISDANNRRNQKQFIFELSPVRPRGQALGGLFLTWLREYPEDFTDRPIFHALHKLRRRLASQIGYIHHAHEASELAGRIVLGNIDLEVGWAASTTGADRRSELVSAAVARRTQAEAVRSPERSKDTRGAPSAVDSAAPHRVPTLELQEPQVAACLGASPYLVALSLHAATSECHLRIRRRDLIRHIWTSAAPATLRTTFLRDHPVARSIALHNRLSDWAAVMVLAGGRPSQRARMLEKLVDACVLLAGWRSLDAVVAVVAGLQHSYIARLGNTWAAVSPRSLTTFSRLAAITQPSNNWAVYRAALEGALITDRGDEDDLETNSIAASTDTGAPWPPPHEIPPNPVPASRVVPYLGVHLQDFIGTSVGNRHTLEVRDEATGRIRQLINWRTYELLDSVLTTALPHTVETPDEAASRSLSFDPSSVETLAVAILQQDSNPGRSSATTHNTNSQAAGSPTRDTYDEKNVPSFHSGDRDLSSYAFDPFSVVQATARLRGKRKTQRNQPRRLSRELKPLAPPFYTDSQTNSASPKTPPPLAPKRPSSPSPHPPFHPTPAANPDKLKLDTFVQVPNDWLYTLSKDLCEPTGDDIPSTFPQPALPHSHPVNHRYILLKRRRTSIDPSVAAPLHSGVGARGTGDPGARSVTRTSSETRLSIETATLRQAPVGMRVDTRAPVTDAAKSSPSSSPSDTATVLPFPRESWRLLPNTTRTSRPPESPILTNTGPTPQPPASVGTLLTTLTSSPAPPGAAVEDPMEALSAQVAEAVNAYGTASSGGGVRRVQHGTPVSAGSVMSCGVLQGRRWVSSGGVARLNGTVTAVSHRQLFESEGGAVARSNSTAKFNSTTSIYQNASTTHLSNRGSSSIASSHRQYGGGWKGKKKGGNAIRKARSKVGRFLRGLKDRS
ncbi:RAS guanyl releasing protein 1 (calcium and DAG-regulated) [Savitreella phatthalungensis]